MNKKVLFSIILSLLLMVACGESVSPVKETTSTPKEETTIPETDEKKTDKDMHESLNKLTVHYIDAGQADATLFQYTYEDQSYTILYDVGDWNKTDVINYLAKQNISFIDLIIISHPHADHTGQLADIVNTYDVGEVWLSGNTASTKTFQDGLEAVLASDADYYEPRTGDTFDIGSLKIDVLHPKSISGKLNEESISLLFTYGEHRFLFTGDAGKKEELEMMDSGFDIEADVLQLGHHGSNTSTDPAFIKTVKPDVAIYSAGTDNSYGHPHAEVVSLLQNAEITLYGTDIHGTIIVTTDGESYTVETKQSGTVNAENNHSSAKKKEKPKEKPTSQTCIDINHADIEELKEIIHIGSERAEDLVELRPFKNIDELDQITGIGPARIADIKEAGMACVNK